MMVWPTVTWPSPAMTTLPRWRTERIVVPRISSTRVGLVVRLHETAEVDVGVALRRREARVAEELLDGAQVRARAEEMRRERVTERVRRRLRHAAARHDVSLHQARDAPAGQAAAAHVPEDGPVRRRLTGLGARAAIRRERAQRRPADRDDALLPPLAEHADEAALRVDVLPVEAGELADAEPGRVEHLEDRAV